MDSMKILTAREMRLVEASAVAEGLDYLRLMENAGSAAARVIRSRYAVSGRRVTVLCGRGNNGGDGFVIARKLLEAGAEVTVALLCGYPTGLESGEMFSRIQNAGIEIVSLDNQPYAVSDAVKSAALLVDAVYGIGFHGELPVHLRTVFRMANAAPVPIVAVDVPSGVNCDTGEADPDALVAEVTVTFTAMKPGLLDDRCAAFAGCVEVVAIGIDERLMEQFPSARTVIDAGMVKACFSPRAADSHKGTYGTLLNVCGSYGMAGAAVLAMPPCFTRTASTSPPCAAGWDCCGQRFPAHYIRFSPVRCRKRCFSLCRKPAKASWLCVRVHSCAVRRPARPSC